MSLSLHCSTSENQANKTNNGMVIQVFLTETLKQQTSSWKAGIGSRMKHP